MGDLLFYDIEVFAHNSMVVFKDQEGETVRVFSSSLDGLGELVDKGIIKGEGYGDLEEFITGKTLVGYNNYFYDDYILYAMCKDCLWPYIKDWNDAIINKRSTVNMVKVRCCETLDAFQQIDVSRPSLKRVEGNMGVSIEESSVDFNIDRPLTPQENWETFLYCEYDVEQTRVIYNMRKDYYESKNAVIKMLPKHLQEKAVKWNTTSIIGQLLRPKRKAPSRRLVNDEMLELVPPQVAEMWRELDNTIDFKFKKKKVVIQEFGCDVEFGWGGLHGVPRGYREYNNVRLADVSSMYPNILINLNGLSDKTLEYKRILKHRLQLKKEGKKQEQAPYKLILNSTYGLLNNKYSQINNPHLAYSICIYGQISLYVLSQRLANVGAEIINVNTDGVAYRINNNLDERVKKDWEEEFKLNLETDYFKKWYQVDVNNYIAVTDTDYLVTKGGDVNKYHKDRFFANNDIRIVQKALVDHVVYGKDVVKTLRENLDDPLLYQYVLHPGGTYQGVVYNHRQDELLTNRTNRVFATKDGPEIVKKRLDGGTVKFADAPNNMFVWNGDVKDIKNFDKIVDLQWYYDLTMKNLERWK